MSYKKGRVEEEGVEERQEQGQPGVGWGGGVTSWCSEGCVLLTDFKKQYNKANVEFGHTKRA